MSVLALPRTPANLTVGSINSTRAILNAEPSPDEAEFYQLIILRNIQPPTVVANETISNENISNPIHVVGLQPNSPYSAGISAVIKGVESPPLSTNFTTGWSQFQTEYQFKLIISYS